MGEPQGARRATHPAHERQLSTPGAPYERTVFAMTIYTGGLVGLLVIILLILAIIYFARRV